MLPRFSVAFPRAAWDELTAALDDDLETAAILLAGIADDASRPTFLVNKVVWVPKAQYVQRRRDRLVVASPGWMPALKMAADAGLHAIFFHTHPGGDPIPSLHDEAVDVALAESVRIRVNSGLYASLILGGDRDHPTFTGRVVHSDGNSAPIVRARIVGPQLEILPAFDDVISFESDRLVHDRQIRALGGDGQRKLADLRVGVVGAGGTGSAIVEQLVRLGVKELVVIDDDRITPTNVSRVYGSSTRDDGRAKVDVAAANASRIGLGTSVTSVIGRITRRGDLEALRACDVVFGCTDDHTGRLNLSRLSFYYLVPVIDLGVVIDAPDGRIRSITGRVTYVAPGEACLLCRGVVSQERVRDEGYTPAERQRLAGEGYAEGLGEPDPSVIAYTTMVAAWGIADLLERLFGFGESDVPGEIRLRIADRKMTLRRAPPNPDHICGRPREWGLGDQPRFLGQAVWSE